MDENAIAVIGQAQRIVNRVGWRLLEEAALAHLTHTRGLRRARLEPRSEVIQLVTYDGEQIGHIRCDRAAGPDRAWVAIPQPQGRRIGSYPSAQEATEALARACGKLSRRIPGYQET